MPFEGWILIDATGKPWIVKGYEQPDEGYIVVNHRQRGGEPRSSSRHTAAVRAFLECVGREVYVLPRGAISRAIDPERAMKSVELPRRLMELLEILSPDWVGLTGSSALGLRSGLSDYDFLLYSGSPWRVYSALKDLAAEGKIKECINDVRYLKVRDSWSREDYDLLHPLKLLDSCYEDIPFTLRILREVSEKPCCSRFEALGWLEGPAVIHDIDESYLVPAMYDAYFDGVPGPLKLVTWRTRYQELPPGLYLVRGLVQKSLPGGELYVVPDIGGYIRPLQVWTRQHSSS